MRFAKRFMNYGTSYVSIPSEFPLVSQTLLNCCKNIRIDIGSVGSIMFDFSLTSIFLPLLEKFLAMYEGSMSMKL